MFILEKKVKKIIESLHVNNTQFGSAVRKKYCLLAKRGEKGHGILLWLSFGDRVTPFDTFSELHVMYNSIQKIHS